MKSLSYALALLVVVPAASAVSLDFEDLAGAGVVPSGYAGLDWSSGWRHYSNADGPYVPGSGVSRVYNQFGNLGVIRFNEEVTLESLWLAGYGHNQYVEGYDDGVKLFESVHMPSGDAVFGLTLTLNWAGIDEIRIQSTGWGVGHYVVDDLEFSAQQQSLSTGPSSSRRPVPDAGAPLTMLGAGVVAMAMSVARRGAKR